MMVVRLAAVAPLRRRDFRLFWVGKVVSQVGDQIHLVAQSWLVWQVTGSGAAMATMALCSSIPAVGMLLLGGALVDRLPRRWLSIWSDLELVATNGLFEVGGTAAGVLGPALGGLVVGLARLWAQRPLLPDRRCCLAFHQPGGAAQGERARAFAHPHTLGRPGGGGPGPS